jgi:hypothetical protein
MSDFQQSQQRHAQRPAKRQRVEEDATAQEHDHEDDTRTVLIGHKHELVLPPDIADSIHSEDKACIELIMNEVNRVIMSDTVLLSGYSPEELGKIEPEASYKIWNYLRPPDRNEDRVDHGYYQVNVSIPPGRRISYDSFTAILSAGVVGSKCHIKEIASMASSPPMNGYKTARNEFSFRFYTITKPMPVDKTQGEMAVLYVTPHQTSLRSRNPIRPQQQTPDTSTRSLLPSQPTTQTGGGAYGLASSIISNVFGRQPW